MVARGRQKHVVLLLLRISILSDFSRRNDAVSRDAMCSRHFLTGTIEFFDTMEVFSWSVGLRLLEGFAKDRYTLPFL